MIVAVRADRPEPWHEALAAAAGGAALTTEAADLVLDLREHPQPGPAVWAFEVGLGGLSGLVAPGLRELALGRTTCPVRLVRLLPDGVQVLREGLLALRGDGPDDVADDLRRRLVDWPRWALAGQLAGAAAASTARIPRWPVFPLPGVPRGLAVRRRLRRRRDELLVRERWTLGRCPGVSLADLVAGAALPEPEWAPEMADGYFADPFPLPGTPHLMAERLGLGHPPSPAVLHELAWAPGGSALPIAPGPTSAGHLSYPSAFAYDGTTWCLPESAADGELVLWRRGPEGWERERRLLDVAAVDADLVRHAGRWWLFYGIEGPDKDEELHLASSPDLAAPFVPHPLNPVVRDISAARGGGRPFVTGGALHRPVQDCSTSYGGALAIAEVEVLTEDDFRQRVVRRLAPVAPYADGLHTLNAWGDGVLIDGKRHERAWGALAGKALRRALPRAAR